MKATLTIFSVLLMACVVTGCTTYRAPVMPPAGLFYSNVKAPMDADVNETKMGSKEGMSESVAILSLFAFGDASIEAASRSANITTVQHVDYEYLNILFIYQKFTTLVRGE